MEGGSAMPKTDVYDMNGKVVDTITLSDGIFALQYFGDCTTCPASGGPAETAVDHPALQ